eukprot:7677714-Pyramimonas_sp.AAC.1
MPRALPMNGGLRPTARGPSWPPKWRGGQGGALAPERRGPGPGRPRRTRPRRRSRTGCRRSRGSRHSTRRACRCY